MVASFSSCKDDDSNAGPSTYPMEVRMTDASGPYDAIYIDVQSVDINIDANGADKGWHSLNTNVGIYNLSRLTNGIDTFLANDNLPSENITQIRLILGPNNSVVVNGTSYPLKTPIAQQSGLNLQVHYTLISGIKYAVLLDFDASRSIFHEGNGDYRLEPVIRTTTIATNGAIGGSVSPAALYPAVYAISGTDSIGTYCNNFGRYMIKGLSTGTYKVAFVPLAPYPVKILYNVNVSAGIVTNTGKVSIP